MSERERGRARERARKRWSARGNEREQEKERKRERGGDSESESKRTTEPIYGGYSQYMAGIVHINECVVPCIRMSHKNESCSHTYE